MAACRDNLHTHTETMVEFLPDTQAFRVSLSCYACGHVRRLPAVQAWPGATPFVRIFNGGPAEDILVEGNKGVIAVSGD